MFKRIFILLIMIFISFTSSFSQAKFNVESTNLWLEAGSINESILKADSFYSSGSKLIVSFTLANIQAWDSLNQFTLVNTGFEFYGLLFYKLALQANQTLSNMVLEIESIDACIEITLTQNEILQQRKVKQGAIKDSLLIDFDDLASIIVVNSIDSKGRVRKIQRRIEKKLQMNFSHLLTQYPKYKYEIVSRLDDALIIDMYNFKNVIIPDGYYEKVRYIIKVQQVAKQIKVNYAIFAYYGSGFGVSYPPKSSSDYYDMELDYPTFLETFNLKIKSLISEFINKS